MKRLLLLLSVIIGSCNSKEKVSYIDLTPAEFRLRLAACPVAYLPMGTLEYHGEHLPLGTDGFESVGFFEKLAAENGGIVLPMLFIGPDRDTIVDGKEYYGMENSIRFVHNYPVQQLAGGAYHVDDTVFDVMMHGIMKQLSRAGFRIVVAHGHYNSSLYIDTHKQIFKEKYNLVVMNCWGNDSADYCLMCDHAAANETSLMMYLKPELVRMDNLSSDTTQWPLGLLGQDPRSHASKEFGSNIVEFELKKMSALIAAEVAKIRK